MAILACGYFVNDGVFMINCFPHSDYFVVDPVFQVVVPVKFELLMIEIAHD